jgi:hypothetical protein
MPNDRKFLPLSWKGFAFEPFQVSKQGASLSSLNLPPDLELITVTRGKSTRALVARELAYHHVAQGELNGEPYMVSF